MSSFRQSNGVSSTNTGSSRKIGTNRYQSTADKTVTPVVTSRLRGSRLQSAIPASLSDNASTAGAEFEPTADALRRRKSLDRVRVFVLFLTVFCPMVRPCIQLVNFYQYVPIHSSIHC